MSGTKRVLFPIHGEDGLGEELFYALAAANFFIVVELEDKKIRKIEIYENPHFEEQGRGRQLARKIEEYDVNVIITTNIGNLLESYLEEKGIEVRKGYCGTVREVLDIYLKGDNNDNYRGENK